MFNILYQNSYAAIERQIHDYMNRGLLEKLSPYSDEGVGGVANRVDCERRHL